MTWLPVLIFLGLSFVRTQDYESWPSSWGGCTSYEFSCTNAQCEFSLLYCESASTPDCADGIESVLDCSNVVITFDSWLICDAYEFPCGDDDCILSALFCDGSNCIDSHDTTVEQAECVEVDCSFHEMACTYQEYGGCVSNLRFCDGVNDCIDGLDEPANCSLGMYLSCDAMTTDSCKAVLPYEDAMYPNHFAQTQSDVATFVQDATTASFFDCSEDMSFFLCALYSPYCSPSDSTINFPPCRSLCERIQSQCTQFATTVTYNVTNINCTMFPETECTNYNSACGGNVTLTAGESYDVNHPNYPNNYDGDQYCAWYITTASKYYLAILFANVDIDSGDALSFGEETNPFDTTTVFLDVSGSSLPDNQTTGMQGMWIQWNSARLTGGGKWHVVIEALECGGYYVVDSGTLRTFSSPDLKGKDNADCEWHITAATANKLLVVQFQNFSSWDEDQDIIYVGEGLYYDTSQIAFNHSSNDTLPYDWTATGHEIWVRWITASLSDLTTGWMFTVESVTCGGRYFVDPNKETRDFISPNYPSNYGTNLECVWYIFTTAGDKLATHFSDFETEANVDTVTVGYGGDATNQSTEVMSGSGLKAPPDWLAPSSKIWVKFVSDDRTVFGGFALTVQWVTGLIVTTPEPPPTDYELSIRCMANCDEVISPDEALSAEAACANCEPGEEFTYKWTLYYTASTLGIGDFSSVSMGEDFTSTGTTKAFIYINAGQLEPGRFYKLRANISDTNGGYGKTSWGFITNAPPAGGNCSVSPTSGYAIDTDFSVACENWDDIHTPLRFAVYSKPKGSSLTSLIYAKADTSTTFMLPMGSKSFDYEVDITVEVQDAFGSKASESHTVTVEPPSLTGDDLTSSLQDLTSGEDSMLGNLMAGGNKDAAVSLVVTVASVLNVDTSEDKTEEEAAAALDARKSLRENIISGISSMSESVESVDEVSQMASAVVAMTSVPTELTENSQVSSATSMEALSGSLSNMQNSSESSILSSASAISEGVGNVLSSALASGTSGQQSEEAAAASSSIAKSAVNSVNAVSKAVLSKRVPGLAPVVLNTSSVAIQLQRDAPSDIGGAALTSSGGNFQLPSAATLFGSGADNSFVDTQFTSFAGNPFNWDNTSADISSAIISLSFTDNTGSGIDVSGLDEPIELRLPIGGLLPEPEELNVSTVDPGVDLYYYKLPISKPYTAVHFRIFPMFNVSWEDLNYTIFFRPDELPTKSDYNYSGTLPNREFINDTSIEEYLREEYVNTFFVPSDYTPVAGTYYFAIYFEPGTLNISVQMFTSGCRYWDETDEVFKGDGCHVDNKSTSFETICKCTHLTSFGSDFVVPPNTIDFSEAFANFANLADNASVFSTVIVIFALYVIVAIWARREDKKDVEKWGITPLADNKPGDKFLYQLSVYTGIRAGSGTRSKVFMILCGEQKESEVRILSDKKRTVFQKGKISSFLMAVPSSLGDLTAVRIWHDNSGKGDNGSWYLSKVVVQDLQTKDVTNFLCDKWLAVDRGDCQIQRTLTQATDKELTTFKHQFSNNAKKDFTDGHIWFSIVSRPSHSSFTRVQRLSCCLSLLYTTMIASCMWYKGEDEEDSAQANDHVIKLGPITFSLQAIIIGIMSSLVVFPVNVAVIQLFRKSRPKQPVTISTLIKKPNQNNKKEQKTKEEKSEEGGEVQPGSAVWAVKSDPAERHLESSKGQSKDDSQLNSATERSQSAGSARTRRNSCPAKSSTSLVLEDLDNDENDFNGDKQALVDSGTESIDEPVRGTSPRAFPLLGEPQMNDPGIPSTSTAEYQIIEESAQNGQSSEGVCPDETDVERGDDCEMSGDASSDCEPTTDDGEKEAKKKKKKKPFMFPHWCIYIGWVLVFLSSATSAFFTVLYSMQWGHEKSLEWLISFLVSFFESILVIQPVKVLCIAILLALIIKTPNLSETTGYDIQLADDEEYLHDDGYDDEDLIKYKPPPPPPQDPPSPETLENARIQRQKESEMCGIVRDIVAYSFYLLFLLIIAYGNKDLMAFYYRKSVYSSFFENIPYNNIEFGFTSFYTWVNGVLLPVLYPGTWYNGNNITLFDLKFASDMLSYRVGPPRFRQLRVQAGLCDVLEAADGVVAECIEEYSYSAADNQSYFHGWSTVNNSGYGDAAWTYRSTSELDGVPVYGVRRMFGGDGYVAELGSSYAQLRRRWNTYRMPGGWTDTRGPSLWSSPCTMQTLIYSVWCHCSSSFQQLGHR
ncbi:polycystin-1-like protein 2 [Ptychodera flava]|uniref:polycystin-1-like protein 2 n=1 Tax=Ptychodera flava TaxID=63121 RepID=UPI00396A1CC8